MKYTILTVCSMGLMCATAHAQTSVTLYGVVDAGIAYSSNSNGARQYYMNSANAGGNRWGLIGSEDLGGGLTAVFNLEAGFSSTTGAIGQGGTEFGRNAIVGISSSKYGTVTLGRQSESQYDFLFRYSAGGWWATPGSGYASHPGDLDNLDNFNRVNNSVKFKSISYGGLTGGGIYGFGNKAGDVTQNQIWSLAAAYAFGPFSLAAGYYNARDPNYSAFGNQANGSTVSTNITNLAIAGYASARTQQIIAAGGQYIAGPVTLSLLYTNAQFKDVGSVAVQGLSATQQAFRGTAVFNSYEAGLQYQLTPALALGVAYWYTHNGNLSGLGTAHYEQIDVGADYSLSKRTDVYAYGVYERAGGTDSTGAPARAAITFASPSSSNAQTIAIVGMRHRF
jgi:predicted porin